MQVADNRGGYDSQASGHWSIHTFSGTDFHAFHLKYSNYLDTKLKKTILAL